MQFLTPTAWWFAAVIPVVVLFYLLKRKRVVRLVSSTVLWQRYLADAQATAPFQKLRRNWLLLLQILVLALAVTALARPYFAGHLSNSRLYVIVLDASASMQSTDESPSRFEKARAEALRLVDSLRDSDQMIVLEAGAQAVVRQSTTANKAAMRRAMELCVATDSSTRLTEALKMAGSLTRDNDEAEVHLFSDGAAVDLLELQNMGLRLVYHRVGQRAHNLGITRLEARALPENRRDCAVFVTVANASAEARESRVELLFNGQLLDNRLVSVPGTNSVSLAFRATQPGEGIFTVRLSARDDLAVDNEASVAWREPRPIRVLLATRGNGYLERALRAVGTTELGVVANVVEARPSADVVVLDNVEPGVWPEVNVLAFATMAPEWFSSVGEVEMPPIVDWRSEHPLMRHVSFDSVHVGKARAVSTPSWAVPVVESSQAPLILAGDRGRQRIVWVGFDLWESDWPLRVSFPIFMANAMEWLGEGRAGSGSGSIGTGAPIRVALEPGVRTAEIVLPDGRVDAVSLNPEARELVYGRTERQGVYRVRAGAKETVVCVNLLDAAETSNEPRLGLDLGRFGEVEATTLRAANLEVWRWLVALGLGVMLIEWWYYHRRTA